MLNHLFVHNGKNHPQLQSQRRVACSAARPAPRTGRNVNGNGTDSRRSGSAGPGHPDHFDRTRKGRSPSGRGRQRPSHGSRGPSSSDDIVVVKPAAVSAPNRVAAAQEELDGSKYWDSLLGEDEDEDEDEYGEEEEEGEEGADDLELYNELLAEENEQQAQLRAMYSGTQAPEQFWGPVAVKHQPGKGRGLVTTRQVAAGDMLLVSVPLAIRFCEEGSTPENEELAEQMAGQQQWTQRQLQVLSLLCCSSSEGSAGTALPAKGFSKGSRRSGKEAGSTQDAPASSSSSNLEQPVQPLPLPKPDDFRLTYTSSPGASSSGSTSAGGGPGSSACGQLSLPAEQLAALVNLNCYGEEFEDPVIARLKGASSCGHLGLWPELAMANHSCAPSAAAFLVADRMLLRATADLPKGAEVSLNWAGSALATPLATRRAELQQQFGFVCHCDRCTVEAKLSGSELEKCLQRVSAACPAWGEQLDALVEAGDVHAITALQSELQAARDEVEALMRSAKASGRTKRWLQASIYPLYDLLSLCLDQTTAEGQIETESLAVAARIVGAVMAGSNTHVEQATEYMLRAEQKFGLEHEETGQASAMAVAAHTARYGHASEMLLGQLMDTRAQL